MYKTYNLFKSEFNIVALSGKCEGAYKHASSATFRVVSLMLQTSFEFFFLK